VSPSLEEHERGGEDYSETKTRDDGSSEPDCSLIVTDGDRVLCGDCHREGFDEQDPMTHFYSTINHGVCDSCGLEVKTPSAGEILNDIKSVTLDENQPVAKLDSRQFVKVEFVRSLMNIRAGESRHPWHWCVSLQGGHLYDISSSGHKTLVEAVRDFALTGSEKVLEVETLLAGMYAGQHERPYDMNVVNPVTDIISSTTSESENRSGSGAALCPADGSDLQSEVWECRVCGKDAPCRVEITHQPTKYPHVESQPRFTTRNRGCLCEERLDPAWFRLSNVRDDRQTEAGERMGS